MQAKRAKKFKIVFVTQYQVYSVDMFIVQFTLKPV